MSCRINLKYMKKSYHKDESHKYLETYRNTYRCLYMCVYVCVSLCIYIFFECMCINSYTFIVHLFMYGYVCMSVYNK